MRRALVQTGRIAAGLLGGLIVAAYLSVTVTALLAFLWFNATGGGE